MLLSEKINHAFNAQIGHELGNSHQYLAIAAYFERESLFGLAKIYSTQSVEERDHAMKFVKFLLDAGGKVVIPAVPAPGASSSRPSTPRSSRSTRSWAPPARSMTWSRSPREEKNYIALNFLQWFVNEQLEEVSSAETRLSVIRRAGASVLMVEAYLAHDAK